MLHILAEKVAIAVAQQEAITSLRTLHETTLLVDAAGDVFLQLIVANRGTNRRQQYCQGRQSLLAVHHRRFGYCVCLDEHDASEEVRRRVAEQRGR